MIVKQADIWHLKLPFLLPVKHHLATHEESENIVFKIITAQGITGYGEGIPREFVTGETLAGSLEFLKESLAPLVMHRPLGSPEVLRRTLEDLRSRPQVLDFPASFCALEMALLDAGGKTWGKSLAELIGPPVAAQVVYSAVLPMAPGRRLEQFLRMVKLNALHFVKVKVGNEADLEVLEMARAILGWEVDLRVDANSAWTPEEAVARIAEMAPYRISAVEQPVAKDDFLGMKEVSDRVEVPIIADESLCTREDAQKLIELKACRIFNLRLSKCGGLGAAAQIRRMAQDAGIRCQLGCHVGETSILSAAGRHFALCTPDLAYLEGSLSPYLLVRDPVSPPVAFDAGGRAYGLTGPGLGIRVRDEALDALALDRFTLS